MDVFQKRKERRKQILYTELDEYELKGIKLSLEGESCVASDIVDACFIEEESIYMRDYINDEKGGIKEINFRQIKYK